MCARVRVNVCLPVRVGSFVHTCVFAQVRVHVRVHVSETRACVRTNVLTADYVTHAQLLFDNV